ncbi:MAG: hypothetical protein RR559_05075, partial [Bacteroides sp.]
TDAETYAYDNENRWIKRTKANGRVYERAMMCCGPLWTKDEDGVTTSYSYNSARQLVETIRSATETTPETIISYTRDALGKILTLREDIGSMTALESREYDMIERLVKETDILGRINTHDYSTDGLTETVTTPTRATLVTKRHIDGTILEETGTGTRHLIHNVEATNEGIRTTTTTVDDEGNRIMLLRITADGFGQTVKEEVPNKSGNWIITIHSYNEKGQETQRTEGTLAPILFEYDSMGHLVRQTVKLEEVPTPINSRVTEWTATYTVRDDGVYWKVTTIFYTPQGTPFETSLWKLETLSDPVLARKDITIDVRGNETIVWTEYGTNTKRIEKKRKPDSITNEEQVFIDGMLCSFKDTIGLCSKYSYNFHERGKRVIHIDARGNTNIVEQDIAGRTVKSTDGQGNIISIDYDLATGKTSLVTDAVENTYHCIYDIRGRIVVEYGTGIQPTRYSYDEADHLVCLCTFRVSEELITDDPSDRSDGDTTRWEYDPVTGLLLKKIYPDGSSEVYDYDVMNRLELVMNGRSTLMTKTYSPLTGELLSLVCKDGGTTNTPSISYTYNHLGMVTSVADGAGIRTFSYNDYAELSGETTQGLVACNLEYTYDTLGRSFGYSLTKDGTQVQNITWDYDDKGRFNSISMNGIEVPFVYGYNLIHGLLETLSYPNTMKRWYTYEEHRNFVTKIDYLRHGSQNYPAKVDYAYDVLGRPISKKDYFNSPSPDLSHDYAYNGRNELIADSMSRGGTYEYSYDNIGNRIIAQIGTAASVISYDSNQLNQYTSIIENSTPPFVPTYDGDGNQTKIKTTSGDWIVTYNTLNQAIRFEQGVKRIECIYDYLNRR